MPGVVHSVPDSLWLVTANITSLNEKILPTLHVDPTIAKALAWGDYVSVGLWGACARQKSEDLHGILCTALSISYSFHPASVWSHSNGTAKVDIELPPKVLKIIDEQKKHTILIKVFFLVGLVLSAACLTLGGIATCAGGKNRHPTFERRLLGYAALLSLISTLLLMGGAAITTHAYGSLIDVMNPAFGDYIIFTLGRAAMAMLWASAIFALLAATLWTQSWRREQKYKRFQGVKGTAAWAAGRNDVHIDEAPSGEITDDKPLLQKDTAYHSPKHT
ncbi:hypothetical protein OPT61_g1941 [Boeremia exigua]|uniref:Uncharacterized protein n=1 Tax=Boeremia exigua TaxID=749465 RepID=A0ACC2INB0_9PLEO|nr:hypothetical protein OPT61_g1941 [Boeremia exigua]